MSKRDALDQAAQAADPPWLAVLEPLNAPVLVSDMETDAILYVNERGRSLFGDVVGQTCWQVWHGREDAREGCRAADLFDANGQPSGACSVPVLSPKNGRHYDCSNQALPWEQGRYARLQMAVDITDQVEATERLDRQRRFAQAQQRISSRLLEHDEADTLLAHLAREVGETLAVDRVQIFDVSLARQQVVHLSTWSRPGFSSPSVIQDQYPLELFHASLDVLWEQRHWLASDRDDPAPSLIADGSERLLHWDMGILALLWYPFAHREEGFYLLALHQVAARRPWAEDELDFCAAVTLHVQVALKKLWLLAERQSAEQRLDAERERLAGIVEGTHAGTWEWMIPTGEGRFNRRWEEIVGYAPGELGRIDVDSWSELVHPDDRERFRVELQAHLDRQTPFYESEMRLRHRDGRWRWVAAHGRVAKWSDEDPPQALLMQGILQDIDTRRRIEQRFQQVTAHSRLIAWEVDTQGLFTYVSDASTEVLGYRPEEVIGCKYFYDLHPPEGRERFAAQALAAFAEKQPFERFENPILTADGRVIWVETNGIPVLGADGVLRGYCGTDLDITERKQHQRVLEENTAHAQALAAEAASANRAKSEFLANMSHELRTPLNGVIGMTSLLMESGLNADQKRFAKIVWESAENLHRLIEDLLDFSRIEAGRLRLERQAFDLTPLLDDLATSLEPRAQEQGLALSCCAEPGVPQGLWGDPGRLRQILTNLVGNAIKFTPQGQVSVRVARLEQHPDAVILRFAVRDTGIGISPEDSARLFERFTQVDASMTREHGGVGLGLAIAKQLTEMMDGEIGVDSQPGQGAEFWFTARLGLQTQAEPAPSLPQAPPRLNPHARVLVVDDNPTNRAVAQGLLQRIGVVAECAEDGEAALMQLDKQAFDLVLMDIEMPGLDGLEVTKRLRAPSDTNASSNPALVIVAMTAHARPEDRARCLEAGMNDYLAKPLNPQAVAEVLGKWLAAAPMSPRPSQGG